MCSINKFQRFGLRYFLVRVRKEWLPLWKCLYSKLGNSDIVIPLGIYYVQRDQLQLLFGRPSIYFASFGVNLLYNTVGTKFLLLFVCVLYFLRPLFSKQICMYNFPHPLPSISECGSKNPIVHGNHVHMHYLSGRKQNIIFFWIYYLCS